MYPSLQFSFGFIGMAGDFCDPTCGKMERVTALSAPNSSENEDRVVSRFL
jgi:hypothetical protein